MQFLFPPFVQCAAFCEGAKDNKKTAVPTNGNGGFNYRSTQPQGLLCVRYRENITNALLTKGRFSDLRLTLKLLPVRFANSGKNRFTDFRFVNRNRRLQRRDRPGLTRFPFHYPEAQNPGTFGQVYLFQRATINLFNRANNIIQGKNKFFYHFR